MEQSNLVFCVPQRKKLYKREDCSDWIPYRRRVCYVSAVASFPEYSYVETFASFFTCKVHYIGFSNFRAEYFCIQAGADFVNSHGSRAVYSYRKIFSVRIFPVFKCKFRHYTQREHFLCWHCFCLFSVPVDNVSAVAVAVRHITKQG